MEICAKKIGTSREKEETDDNNQVKAFQTNYDYSLVWSIEQITDWLRVKDKDDEVQQQWYHIASVVDRVVFCSLLPTVFALSSPVLLAVMGMS